MIYWCSYVDCVICVNTMKMQKCPHCSEENKIYARVCSYCMKTIGVEHKIKMSSVGNWVIVFIVVVVCFIWSMNKG